MLVEGYPGDEDEVQTIQRLRGAPRLGFANAELADVARQVIEAIATEIFEKS